MAHSTVTSKFQTTIPKEVRERLGVSIAAELRWEVRDGEAVVTLATPAFLARRGSIVDGPDPARAVRQMRSRRGKS